LLPSFKDYVIQIQLNSKKLSSDLLDLDFKIVSGGTDNHLLLIDLRNKNITGKDAEISLGKANITVNKNMIPYDEQPPFVTSGIRIGTPAITTRGFKEEDMGFVAQSINDAINNYENDEKLNSIYDNVKKQMKDRPLFA
ncbi:MAG: serine hydroxymethyltransferase, partial [Flavobacteriaceae bacterium]